VRPDTPARIALFLRPAPLETEMAKPRNNSQTVAPAGQSADVSWNVWSPGY